MQLNVWAEEVGVAGVGMARVLILQLSKAARVLVFQLSKAARVLVL